MANSHINPATGVWDDNYANGGSGGSLSDVLGGIDKARLDEINKYVGELKATAQQNYDFVVKYLKKQHEVALGNNDTERAKFMEQVANVYEKQVGRIPFDYETKTAREKQDIADYLKKSEILKQDALARESQFGAQQDFEKKLEQKQLAESMNTRGLLNSGIQKVESNRLALARQLFTEDPFYRSLNLEKTQREEADRLAKQQSERNLFDITTGARRSAIDEANTLAQGTEAADIKKKQADEAANIAGEQAKRQALSYLGSYQVG